MPSFKTLLRGVLVAAMLVAGSARAELNIEIIGGGASRHAISVLPFKDEGPTQGNLTPVIRNDLALSGAFRLIDPSAVANVPFEPADIRYPLWQAAGAQSLAIGKVESAGGGQIKISFRLMDASQRKQLTGGEFTVTPDRSRQVAHAIADMIYEAITGQKGFFNTRLAYVLKSGRSYALQISDVDGQRSQTILRSTEPIISPSWSPDGRHIAYVSFASQKPVVWVQDLATGQRRAVANFKGSNSAPAWSPDGSKLAVVLTTSGNSQIYIINAAGGPARRLMYNGGIDTEPAFSPDGSMVYFVSDRSGNPQIYRVPVNGGNAQRVTWEGAYNVSPKLSPDGKTLVYIRRSAGNFRVMSQDLATNDSRQLSDGSYSERPSFAPNGRMVLYSSDAGGQSVLYAATADGSSKVKLAVLNGDVQDPAWGPFNNP
ncbi:Tol-Pal system beta propeller repeat protein TolB [Chromobacterium violaceum]|uniref:Tol-Pal system beta propeller repeat protein TolB n=1 Tax=Chromobacterium violaceum TaxID=536 RepID=UPI0009D92A32|nr:Tol-Pal system beta propeller repeat protein TolB [Chromobacterium violaceum]OQS10352.1 Tol-Pal system beta propeller repeat protein TolB [Chromobacterium violaceum]OQS29963.1 Tol-Pal system beta propeller repeat protein TolB [Chromobacterium violaceum]